METIRIEVDGRGVARLVLARAGKHNALSAQMIDELTDAAGRLGRDPAVRVVVLAADGPTFCAGGDLAWMQAQMAADGAARAREATKLAMMLQALNEMPKPLVGAVHGNAFGGGVGMISVCDVAVGVEPARFGLTETRLGIIPATIGPYVIARMGEAMAPARAARGRPGGWGCWQARLLLRIWRRRWRQRSCPTCLARLARWPRRSGLPGGLARRSTSG